MGEIKECRIANSPAEAVAMLKAGPGKGCYLAGGTNVCLTSEKIDFVVDINQAGLSGIDGSEAGDVLIGAATTLQECFNNRFLNAFAGGAISRVAGQYGERSLRMTATIGGNLCTALPAADMAPVLMALDAVCIILDEESQESISLAEFFISPRETVLENRLLAGLVLPGDAAGWVCHSFKLSHAAEGTAVVQVAVALEVKDDVVTRARIVLGGVGPVPLRSQLAENLLVDLKLDQITPDLVENVALVAASETDPADDHLASAEYRMEKVQLLTRRMICRALAEKGMEPCQDADYSDGNDGGVA